MGVGDGVIAGVTNLKHCTYHAKFARNDFVGGRSTGYVGGVKHLFVQTEALKLILNCKDCHRPVTDSETNAYQLIKGVLYGWCNECFHNRHSRPTCSAQDPFVCNQHHSAGL
jgi:hypothetical protein